MKSLLGKMKQIDLFDNNQKIEIIDPMTKDEAEQWQVEVETTGQKLGQLLYEGYKRDAWRVLGYRSMTQCIKELAEKSGFSRPYAFQLLESERLKNDVLTIVSDQGSVAMATDIKERQTRSLSKLPTDDEKRKVWQAAVETAPNGKVTAKHVEKVVMEYLGLDEDEDELPPLLYDGFSFAYCKYCYETHDRWDLSGDHDPDAWECCNCGHFTADQYMDLREKPIFTCPECNNSYDTETFGDTCPYCYKEVEGMQGWIEDLPKVMELPADVIRIQARSTNEWYTPQIYLDSAREVLGTFDLDPASSKEANDNVKAKAFCTIDDNGLDKSWYGKIWLNPPYGRIAGEFAQKLVLEYKANNVTEAILLVNANSTDTKWFADLWDYVLCFTDHRIDFSSPDNEGNNNSTHGSVFIYLGDHKDHFQSVFNKHGVVVERRKLNDKYQKS